jgi:N-acetylmuramoyl-L-alanine amidase
MSPRRTVKLKGDYIDYHERQEQARNARCRLVLEFHFNSNGSRAIGGESWYRPNDLFSRQVASDIRNRYQNIGLPLHGDGPYAAVEGSRAGWIRHYDQAAILLEPLFVSNPDQTAWIHDAANLSRLAEQVAEAIVSATQESDLIGLSVGHRYKTSSPHDEGAPCRLGDNEADHNESLCNKVAELLGSGTMAPTELLGGSAVVPTELLGSSWNIHSASPLLPQLFQAYLPKPNTGFADVFHEQVRCSPADWHTVGSGTGADFQELSKKCLAFAAEFAGVGLRNLRRHWGPINNLAAEVRPEADEMFQLVQKAIDASPGLYTLLL